MTDGEHTSPLYLFVITAKPHTITLVTGEELVVFPGKATRGGEWLVYDHDNRLSRNRAEIVQRFRISDLQIKHSNNFMHKEGEQLGAMRMFMRSFCDLINNSVGNDKI